MTQFHTAQNYRPEIDGLRAWAVVPVMLFHAGWSAVPGGFVGVDVFFVISGYLITWLLLADLAAGRLSLWHFYERRARRILPALLAVTLCFGPLALRYMAPYEIEHFGKSMAALAVFGANVFFWQTTDYFAPGVETQPLLHTWSLAVEEQFYIVFPLLLLLLMRGGRRLAVGALLALALASLLLAQWASPRFPAASYFLLPTRAWELLLGVLLAFLQGSRPVAAGSAVASCLAALGLGLIAAAVFLFTAALPHPGVYTLVPTLGAALVIRYAAPANLAGRLLGLKPVVGMGLISYSAYLIHQPLLAFARLREGAALPPSTAAGLLLLVVALAWLCWRFIEQPCRRATVARPRLFAASALGLGLTAVAGGALVIAGPQAALHDLPQSVLRSFYSTADIHHGAKTPATPCWMCRIDTGRAATGGSEGLDFVFVGDSHMASLLPAVTRWAEEKGAAGAYAGRSGCPPLLGREVLEKLVNASDCMAENERLFQFVRAHGVRNVVMAARWTYYAEGGEAGEGGTGRRAGPGAATAPQAARQAFAASLRHTVLAWRDLGVRVHVILQVPQQVRSPLVIYDRARGLRDAPMRRVLAAESLSRAQYAARQADTNRLFQSLQAAYPATLRLIDPATTFCSAQGCPVGDDTVSYYRDDDHLSLAGAQRMLPQLRRELELAAPERARLAGGARQP